MRPYRSDAGWQEHEKDIRADAMIVSMSPTKLSLGMVASPQSPLPFRRQNHCTSHRDWRSDLISLLAEELALSAWVPLAGTEVTDASAGREKNALDSACSRLWSATSKSTTSRLAWLRSYLIVLLLYRCLVRTKSHKARQKAAGSALSMKLEKYLSRPSYESHISFIETFHEGLRQEGIGWPRGIRTPRC
jgi:hypothetical protein